MQLEGCGEQVARHGGTRLAGQLQEHPVGVAREARVGGEHAHVGVQARRAGVVVAGGEMPVAAQVGAFAARYQQQLGVRLQAHHAVDHLRAHGFQAFGPVDVGLFVKARLQLHHHQHFLAAARGFDQQVHQHALGAGAVDGLLDGQYIGIVHGFAQELHHGLEALEGVVQQHITLLQPLEHRLRARPLGFGPARVEAREVQRRAVGLVDELVQAHQIHRPVDLVQGLLGQAELFEQKAVQIARATGHDFQAQRLAIVAGAQAGAQGLTQVGDVVFVHIQIRVARHAKLRERFHRAPRKQLAQVRADDAGQQHKALAPSAQGIGQADDPRQHPRHLDDGDEVLAPEHITATQARDEVQRLVGDLRKGVAGVQAHRHQQRAHLRFKEVLHPLALGRVALGVVEHDDAFALQRRHHDVVEQRVLVLHQLVGRRGNGLQVLARDTRAGPVAGFDQVRHSHFKKLVQVGRNDGHVAQALQQRHIGTLRLGQHAAVELQDGPLAVEQRRRRHRLRVRTGAGNFDHRPSL